MPPEVSVVLGVRNGAHHVEPTLRSILAQVDADLELIVVDDGSTDSTRDVLERVAAADPRVRVERQPAAGLTAALIRGCEIARGAYIARQDAGDRSVPDRLARQLAELRRDPTLVMVAARTRFIGLHGETAFENAMSSAELSAGLRPEREEALRGPPSHGSVMFRADAYRRVGGYRAAFAVAQDIDLWLRLAECGEVRMIDTVLYEAECAPGSITATRRAQQSRMAGIAFRARLKRQLGQPEDDLLEEARACAHDSGPRGANAWRDASFLYFLGRCQARVNPALARRYYLDALHACPWHVRSYLGVGLSALGR